MARQNFGFGGGANMQQLMRQAQKLQEQIILEAEPFLEQARKQMQNRWN